MKKVGLITSSEILLLLLVVFAAAATTSSTSCDAFSVVVLLPTTSTSRTRTTTTTTETTSKVSLFAAAGNKRISMAEKRRRRAAKRKKNASDSSKLKRRLPPPPPIGVVDSTDEKQDDNNKEKEKIHVANPKEAATKAQELLQAQRDSVNMLTLVRERVEEMLGSEVIKETIEKQGYCYVDDFLSDTTTLQQLDNEGRTLLESGKMQIDMENLGSGEYICSLQGGKDEYNICPRSIEFVVSTTKHFPSSSSSLPLLDSSNCISQMRTFDRKAFQASLDLLTGGDGDGENNDNENGNKNDDEKLRPFRLVEDGPNDRRKISLRYYLVPEEWSEDGGGGDLTFQPKEEEDGGGDGTSTTTVQAKRDRIVLWKSDSTLYRNEPWWVGISGRGDEDSGSSSSTASCIELHLLEK